MGKIYDALKRAEKEAQAIRNKDHLSDTGSVVVTRDEPSVSQNKSKQDSPQPQIKNPTITKTSEVTNKISDLKLISGNIASGQLINDRRKFSLSSLFTRKQKSSSEVRTSYLPTIEDPQSIAAEQYKFLTSRILSFCEQNNIRTLLITSSIPCEGKSTVASNLSISIANRINDHALLIDSDLRKPTVHKTFPLNNHSGLSDYLSGTIPVAQILHKTTVEKLTVLPAGTHVNNPAELLSSKKMVEFIEEITNRYNDRYIIFDSTPLQNTPEPVILSKHIDGIIFVVRAGFTNRDLVIRSVDSLDKKKVIGIVFNMVQDHIQTNYYSYYNSQQTQ